MKEDISEPFQRRERYIADLTYYRMVLMLSPITFSFIHTRIAVEFGVGIFIEIDYTITFFMKALVAVITVDDFIFLADVGGEADFAVCLEDGGEL